MEESDRGYSDRAKPDREDKDPPVPADLEGKKPKKVHDVLPAKAPRPAGG